MRGVGAQPNPAQLRYTAQRYAAQSYHHIGPAALGGSPRRRPRPTCQVPVGFPRFANQLAVLRIAAVRSNLLQRAAMSHCDARRTTSSKTSSEETKRQGAGADSAPHEPQPL